MDFSLSSSLVGNAVSNPDKLALDLQFAADKTLTARKGPTPVFTRASIGTFVGSNKLIQSAAINTPRFDHDPVTGVCKGLLMEESRTNNVLNSGNPTLWTFTGTNEGSFIAPDGSNGLRAGLGAAQLVTNSVSTTSATAYTISVFLKRDNTDWIRVQYNHASNANLLNAWFNLSTGTLGTVSVGTGTVTSISASIVPAGNGWYRCSVTGTTPTTGSLTETIISATSDNSLIRVAGSIYGVWGGQIELGSFPTSYIPTTTASVVRSADVCSITGANFTSFWNRFAGTCTIGIGSSLGTQPRFISNLVAARAVELYGSTNIDFFEASGSQEIRIISNPIYPIKLGLAYAINDYQSAYNGILSGADTNTGGTIPNATELHIGNLGGTSNRLTGHIQFIRYYKKRLANAKLQAITV